MEFYLAMKGNQLLILTTTWSWFLLSKEMKEVGPKTSCGDKEGDIVSEAQKRHISLWSSGIRRVD